MDEQASSGHPTSAPDDVSRLCDLMDTYRRPLLTYAQRLTGGDAARAEDVVQETFLRAWTHIDRLTADRGSVIGWLRRVVHNLVMDSYRKERARPTEVELEHAATTAEADRMTGVLDALLVEQVLSGLWPQHRAALEETYLKDRTAAEAGAALGVPVGTVKSRVHYGLRAARGTVSGFDPRAA